MKIYGNLETFELDKKDLFPSSEELIYYFDIKEAKIAKNMYGNKHALSLKLNPVFSGVDSCVYGLIGDNYQREFLEDMGLNKIEELPGKVIFGIVHRKNGLEGIFTPVEMYKNRG
jgi:hypothetical protein